MIVKIHARGKRRIVAVCDSSILGRKFEQGKLILDLQSEFYRGEEKSPAEALKIMQRADVVNIVGKDSVALAIKNNLVAEGNTIIVADVPHAQVLFLRKDD